ncbi:hypothetical protein RIF29_07214 [Crotalaria pallida]|uniref:Sm domain-containing protein n=1 Tax=Crotalaria pallida TaxID=3830 RepID=A0AAN9J3X2_CROPI
MSHYPTMYHGMSRFAPRDPPPELLTTSFLDKEVLVLTQDGKQYCGLLCTFDHHGNLVLEAAFERIIVGDLYCDIKLDKVVNGFFLIRGNEVCLIGQMDMDRELPQHMRSVSEAEIRKAQKVEKEANDLKRDMMKRMGFLDFDDYDNWSPNNQA